MIRLPYKAFALDILEAEVMYLMTFYLDDKF